MIGLIQRVKQASVCVNNNIVGEIKQGILLLLGIEQDDSIITMKKLCHKVANYRIFNDTNGKMNLSLQDVQAELLIVSQFTLVADTQKGMRASFSKGASPQQAQELYTKFIDYAQSLGIKTATGKFGHEMQISLINDGPVTFILSAT